MGAHGMLKWTNENLTLGEVNKFILTTGNEGKAVFHVVADCAKVVFFMKNAELSYRVFSTILGGICILTEIMGVC
jgi:hypothetical protein